MCTCIHMYYAHPPHILMKSRLGREKFASYEAPLFLSLWPPQISHFYFFKFSLLSVIHSVVTWVVLHLLRKWVWSIKFLTKKKKAHAFFYIIFSNIWNLLIVSRMFKGFTEVLCCAFCAHFGIRQWSKIVPCWRKEKENPLK